MLHNSLPQSFISFVTQVFMSYLFWSCYVFKHNTQQYFSFQTSSRQLRVERHVFLINFVSINWWIRFWLMSFSWAGRSYYEELAALYPSISILDTLIQMFPWRLNFQNRNMLNTTFYLTWQICSPRNEKRK